MLSGVNGGKEPTGRMPFLKAPFKMILAEPDETTDEVEMKLAFRFGFVDPFGNEHFTPYFIEVPFMTFKVNDIIFLGVS